MPRKLLSPLSTRSSFVGRTPSSDKPSILLPDAAVLTSILIGCLLVGLSALLSDDLRRGASLGTFVAVQTTVFAFGSVFLSSATLITGYVTLMVDRWDVTLAMALLCTTIAIASIKR